MSTIIEHVISFGVYFFNIDPVSYQQVRTWVLRFREMGEAGLEDRRGRRKKDQTPRTREEELEQKIAQLEHEKYLLEAENWLLKKVKELERRDASHK